MPFVKSKLRIKLLLGLLMAIFLWTIPQEASAQRRKDKGTTASEAMKDQKSAKEARVKEFDNKMAERRKRHVKVQDKKTRKRMKKNRKRAERIAQGKSAPFYKRWFRKK